MNMMEDMALDAEAVASAVNINEGSLSKISFLAAKQISLQAECDLLETELKLRKADLEQVATRDLPDALSEVGMASFTMSTGEKISVKPFYSAKINDANRSECFDWLDENGHGDIIKHSISVSLAKGETAAAEQVMKALDAIGIQAKVDLSVHSSTLTAFIREQVEAGADFPLEMFNTFIGRKATIKA